MAKLRPKRLKPPTSAGSLMRSVRRLACRLSECDRPQAGATISEFARRHLNHLSTREHLGQKLVCLAILRILEGRGDDCPIGQVKARIRKREALSTIPEA